MSHVYESNTIYECTDKESMSTCVSAHKSVSYCFQRCYVNVNPFMQRVYLLKVTAIRG